MTRQRWKLTSAVAGGNDGRQRLTAVMDEGGRWRLTVAMGGSCGSRQRWMIETVFNGSGGSGVRWRQQRYKR